MAIGVYKLSQKNRNTLASIIYFVCTLEMAIGLCMAGSSIYTMVAVSPIIHSEKSEVDFAFAITGIFGTHIIIQHVVGYKVCYKCVRQAYKKSTKNLLFLWSCIGANMTLNLVIICHYLRKLKNHIAKSIKQSFMIGMGHYLKDVTWKETIDRLQYDNECCGIFSFQDWEEKAWLTRYHVNVECDTIKEYRISEDILSLPVIPWSCCKVDFPMQCLHDPLQQPQFAHIWVDEPSIVRDSINTRGCLDGLTKLIFIFINTYICMTALVFILQGPLPPQTDDEMAKPAVKKSRFKCFKKKKKTSDDVTATETTLDNIESAPSQTIEALQVEQSSQNIEDELKRLKQ
nr:unnamed protein product [Callosobruchus chinensis]